MSYGVHSTSNLPIQSISPAEEREVGESGFALLCLLIKPKRVSNCGRGIPNVSYVDDRTQWDIVHSRYRSEKEMRMRRWRWDTPLRCLQEMGLA